MSLTNMKIKFSRVYLLAIAILTGLFLVVNFGGSANAFPSGAHLYSDAWAGQPSGLLGNPHDVTARVDNGYVYVLDTNNNRVQAFDQNGVYKFQFGSYGQANGQLNGPLGIGTDGSRIFVADTGNDRVEVFSKTGGFLTKFGTTGSGTSQFNRPIGIGYAGGTLYVADSGNNRISTWAEASANNFIIGATFGTGGTANGQFATPFGVDAISVQDGSLCGSHNEIYVADTLNNRIQRFTGGCLGLDFSPTYTTKWASGTWPYKAKLDPTGANVYAVSPIDQNVRETTNTGTAVTTWGSQGNGNGQFRQPRGLGIAANGKVFVADATNNRIQRFSSSGTYETKWGVAQSGDGEFDGPRDVATDASGNIYVVDTNNSRIQKFNSSGRYLLQWGGLGTGNGQFTNPEGIGIDTANNKIYIADTGNNRVQVFDLSGTYLSKFGTTGSGNGQLNAPRDVTTIGTVVYVVDGANSRVEIFNNDGTYNSQFGSAGSGNSQFSFPLSTVSQGAYVYVSDSDRVQKFLFNGTFVTSVPVTGAAGVSWANDQLFVTRANAGAVKVFIAPAANPSTVSLPYEACTNGSKNGQLSNPQGIQAVTNNTAIVADQGNNRVEFLSMSGDPFGVDPSTCGAYGTLGNSDFSSPADIAETPNGNIYVADTGNRRVVGFSPAGQSFARWGIGGGSEGFNGGVTGVAASSDGTVLATDQNTLRRFAATGAQSNSVSAPNVNDVAVGPSGDVYTITNTSVSRYNPALAVQNTWGSAGSGNGQLGQADGIATDSSGNVYVSEFLNNRVQKFTAAGVYVSQFSSPGAQDVSIGPDGRIYVMSNNAIREYTSTGTLIDTIGSNGSGVGQFSGATGILVSSTGRVYVGDSGNNRVEIFDFTPSRALFDSKITDYGGNELSVPAIPATTVTGGF